MCSVWMSLWGALCMAPMEQLGSLCYVSWYFSKMFWFQKLIAVVWVFFFFNLLLFFPQKKSLTWRSKGRKAGRPAVQILRGSLRGMQHCLHQQWSSTAGSSSAACLFVWSPDILSIWLYVPDKHWTGDCYHKTYHSILAAVLREWESQKVYPMHFITFMCQCVSLRLVRQPSCAFM